MCGITGYIGKKNCLPLLINGLNQLQYRGYDSAGIAYFNDKNVKIVKTVGKIKDLEEIINYNDISFIGIGHTRWATHGGAVTVNAHPHEQGNIVVVHNGIIENYLELKNILTNNGYNFKSETDTEVACAYIDYLYNKHNDMLKVLNICTKDFIGSYAMSMINKLDDKNIYVIKKDSPLVIGVAKDGKYIASSTNAFNKDIDKYTVLADYDYGVISNNDIHIYNNGKIKDIEYIKYDNYYDINDKKDYKHYMLKEINEQGDIIDKLNNKYLNNLDSLIDISKYNDIHIIGCGSAYHAGIVGKYLIEENSNINVSVYIASEYRYQKINYRDNTLVIAISQSGETADTIACIKKAHSNGIYTLGIVNVYDSTISILVDEVIYTDAGTEIAVATTKGYLTQVYILTLLVLKLIKDNKKILEELKNIPTIINKLIKIDYNDLIKDIYKDKNIFYIGRNIDYASMLEGALKLKEISYIHAECYAAGELKHGTISLIEKNTCVVGLITKEFIATKTVSNIKEVKARDAYVILIAKNNLEKYISKDTYDKLLLIDNISDIIEPMISIIPLQLIAYNVALMNNCDIDKPRNLAKSVTVE